MILLYGFLKTFSGEININQSQAKVVQMIYQQYLSGDSLGKISELLLEKQIPSASGKDRWTRAAIDKLLSNSKYVPHIISLEQFCAVQIEKANRSNIDYDKADTPRKAIRYSSQNVLSGLFVCSECGANYRRITRGSGEVVWRCANRVEYGKEICHHSPTISEAAIIDYLCEALNMKKYDPNVVKESIDTVLINKNTCLSPKFKDILSHFLSI